MGRIYNTSTLVKSFEIDLLRNVTRQCSVWDARTERCNAQRTFTASEDVVAKNYKLRGVQNWTRCSHCTASARCPRSKEVQLYMKGFWWCTVEAWERGLHLQLPLRRFYGAISGETERTTDVVQAATAITFLSLSLSPSRTA